jgi:O-antigen/teichoic acid export membrane protein
VLAAVAFAEWVAGVDATTRSASLLLALGVLAELLAGTCFAVFQAYERLGFMPVVIISQRLVTAAVGVTAMLLGAKVVAVCAIYLAAATAAFVLALFLMARAVVRPAATIDVHRWLPLMRAAFPVGVALVLQVLLFRVDAAILKLLEPLDVVGDYGAAYRLFESTLFLGWAVGAAVYPVLARVAGNRWATRMVFERSLKLVLAFTVPAAVGAAVLARPLVELLYGSDFAASARPLQILAPTIVLASLNHIAGVLLLAESRQRYIAVVYGVLAVENIAANFALIPWLSLNGAALNTTLTEVLLVCALVGYSFRLTAAPDWLRLLSGPALAGAVGAAAMLALRAHVVPAVIVGLLAYTGVLAAFERLAYPDDARTVWRFVRRRADAVPT